MRLVDADALKKALNFVYDCAYIDSKSKEGIVSDIIDEIDNTPTVEPCKDCEDKRQAEYMYHCDIDAELHNNVGICNKYKGRCENG